MTKLKNIGPTFVGFVLGVTFVSALGAVSYAPEPPEKVMVHFEQVAPLPVKANYRMLGIQEGAVMLEDAGKNIHIVPLDRVIRISSGNPTDARRMKVGW